MHYKKILASLILACLVLPCAFRLSVAAQDTSNHKAAIAVEARITTYFQSGFDMGVYYHPKNSKFSFGTLFASHSIEGNTKELLFESSNFDNLDMQLSWIVSANVRFHFSQHRRGFFAELGVGFEEFEVKNGAETKANTNGFAAPALGYIWHPIKRRGFYLLPKVNAPIILGRPDEYKFLDGTTYQLKSFFFTPSIAVGWKFGRK